MALGAMGAAESFYNLIERHLGSFWAKTLLLLSYATAVVVLLVALLTGIGWVLFGPVASLADSLRPTLEALDLRGVGLDVAAGTVSVVAFAAISAAAFVAIRRSRLEQRMEVALQRHLFNRVGRMDGDIDRLETTVEALRQRIRALEPDDPVRGFVVQPKD